MPRYDYKCISCNSVIEIEKPINTDSDYTPKCDCGMQMERVWNATAAIFRGGGWGGKP